ncbi:MAG: hypothetical protein PHV34_06160 [Verrucomicrobiae bacterium]|nr:hypothetical protein [Verrucomicrobiae bacterium]
MTKGKYLALSAVLFHGLFSFLLPAGEPHPIITSFRLEPGGNVLRWDRWMEAVVLLRNETSETHSLRLEIAMPSPKGGIKAVFSRPVTLAPQSQQEVRLPVKTPPSIPLGKNNRSLSIPVRLLRNDLILTKDAFLCIVGPESSQYVLWCEGMEAGLAYQVRKNMKNAPLRSLREAHVLISNNEMLPRHTVAYDAFDLVVLSSWKGNGLDPLQTESLLNWVKSGGRLLVIAGSHWFSQPNPQLASHLPLWPSETCRTSLLPEIEKWAGDLGIAEGVEITDGPRFSEHKIHLGNDDQPLLLSRAAGHGRIWFLAADVPRHNDKPPPGMIPFALKTLSIMAENPARTICLPSTSAQGILGQMVAVKIVGREWMAFWLGGYFLAVILILIAARLAKHPGWGYVAVAVLAGAWFFLLQHLNRQNRRQSSGRIEQVRVYLAEMRHDDNTAVCSGIEGFFPSAPKTIGWDRGELGRFDSWIYPFAIPGSSAQEITDIQSADHLGIRRWTLKPNVLRSAAVSSITQFSTSGANYAVRLTKDGLLLEAESLLGWKLSQPFLKWNRFIVPLPDLEPKTKLKFETWKHRDSWGLYQTGLIHGGMARAQNLIRQVVFPDPPSSQNPQRDMQLLMQLTRNRQARRIALGGFSQRDPGFWRKQSPPGSELSLGMWLVLGLDSLLTADPDFYMPPGLAELEMGGASGRIASLGDGFFQGSREETLVVRFSLPSALGRVETSELNIHGTFESLQFKPHLKYAVGSNTVEPKKWEKLAWDATMSIPSPKNVFTDPNNALWIKIDIKLPSATRAPKGEMASLGQNWTLRCLDISLRGKKNANN